MVLSTFWENKLHLSSVSCYNEEKSLEGLLMKTKSLLKDWFLRGEPLSTGEKTVSEEDVAPIRDFVFVDDLIRNTGRGDLRRIMLRKVQSCYGWDQSPKLPTCAIAGDVRLDILDEVVVRDVRFETLELKKTGARILAETEIENRSPLVSAQYHGCVCRGASREGRVGENGKLSSQYGPELCGFQLRDTVFVQT